MKLRIPKTLRINGFVWQVKESEPVAREGNVFGSCHMVTQTIYLDPDMTDQKKIECLLHEILHAVAWQSGLSRRLNDRKLEEEIVTALSFGVYQVLADNGFLKQ